MKNDGVLPLEAGSPLAVIGQFARSPRIQGAGSSQVNPTKVDPALDATMLRAPIEFASGYNLTGADSQELHDEASAILETWLLGQAGGGAIADVLFGSVNPSGRLSESTPLRLQDNSSFLYFPGEGDVVRYGEGVFVGYRYYESADVPVRYPFGHGLSHTEFEYSDLVVAKDGSSASVTVTNVGERGGSDVVQLYVAPAMADVRRPVRELRAFAKVHLEPGELDSGRARAQ